MRIALNPNRVVRWAQKVSKRFMKGSPWFSMMELPRTAVYVHFVHVCQHKQNQASAVVVVTEGLMNRYAAARVVG